MSLITIALKLFMADTDIQSKYNNDPKISMINIDKYEDKINALTSINKTAIIKINNNDVPLKGMNIIIKDTFLTSGLLSTSGSEKYKKYIPEIDAEVVSNIKKSGGIILAKSNTPEFAMDYQTFNKLWGVTNNPYDTEYTCGGSSGGSAAALRMGYANLAIGSDLGGSLRQPASFCGVYSLRPTFGSLSDHGQLPAIKESTNYMATAGPLSTDLMGLKLLFYAMKNEAEKELKINKINISDLKLLFTPYLEEIPIDSRIVELMINVSEQIMKNGVCVDYLYSYDIKNAENVYLGLFKVLMGNQEIDKEHFLELQHKIQDEQAELIAKYDAWILPVCSVIPFKHNPEHNNFVINDNGHISLEGEGKSLNYWVANGMYCRPTSVSGFPTITIPIGMIDGFPVGMQIIGKPDEENHLFEVVSKIDNLLGNRITQPKIVKLT